jgi:hypothetical protein
MPEEPSSVLPVKSPKGDLLWICLCTSTEVAVAIILNKYSASMPVFLIIGICAIPIILFIAVAYRYEKQHRLIKSEFLEHPVSYSLLALIFLPFFWYSTATMVAKLRLPMQQSAANADTQTQAPIQTPTRATIPEAKVPQSPRQPVAKGKVPHKIPSSRPPAIAQRPAAPSEKAPPPTQSIGAVDCGNSNNCAGINNGQQIVNKYEGVPVNVTTSFDVPQPTPSKDGHPRTAAKFYIDVPWKSGLFAIVCDRPCHSDNDSVCGLPGYNQPSWGTIPNEPNLAVLNFGRQFPAGFWRKTSVTSNDESPVIIIRVATLNAPSKPKEP